VELERSRYLAQLRTGMKKNKNACILGSIYHSKIDPTLFPISQGRRLLP
jgi:hypothetical protein